MTARRWQMFGHEHESGWTHVVTRATVTGLYDQQRAVEPVLVIEARRHLPRVAGGR